jgi:hypothetical protein
MQRTPTSEIRSVGLSKVNSLVRAARHLEELRLAFAQWQAGEIYVCKKTGSYRFRFGEQSKSPAPWSKLAESLFQSPAAFAFAAMVLAPAEPVVAVPSPGPATQPARRANVIALANAA